MAESGRFERLFLEMDSGSALHEIITDEHGKPVDYKFLAVNPAFERLTGIAEADIVGKTVLEVLPGTESHWIDTFGKVALTGEPAHIENFSAELGKYYQVTSYSPQKNQFAVIFNDVTRLKQVENELKKKNAELERFNYTVSHDLKSPLITIKGFLGMLRQDLADENIEAIEKDISYVCDAADKMGALLEEILEYSRIGQIIQRSAKVSLSQIAGEALKLVHGQITQTNVNIKLQPDMPSYTVDTGRIGEVYQNLIDNAIKFLPPQPEPQIEIGCRLIEGVNTFYVRDNGPGIDERYLEKIFGLFDQLDPTIPGTGVGLSLARRIIEAHGGAIWAESNGLHPGTTFYFTLAEGGVNTHD